MFDDWNDIHTKPLVLLTLRGLVFLLRGKLSDLFYKLLDILKKAFKTGVSLFLCAKTLEPVQNLGFFMA